MKNAGGVIVGMKTQNISSAWAGNLMLMMELRSKTLIFRDTIDLPPCNGSSLIHEVPTHHLINLLIKFPNFNPWLIFGILQLVMGTVEDLHNLYPNVVPYNQAPEILEKISTDQVHKKVSKISPSIVTPNCNNKIM